MSMGSAKIVVRMQAGTMDEIEAAVESHNRSDKRWTEQWTVSDLVRKAIGEYLDKLERGRSRGKKKAVSSV